MRKSCGAIFGPEVNRIPSDSIYVMTRQLGCEIFFHFQGFADRFALSHKPRSPKWMPLPVHPELICLLEASSIEAKSV